MVKYADEVTDDLQALLFQPLMAGGLLISTPDPGPLMRALNDAGVAVVQIGEVLENTKPRIRVSW
jgi:hypothetical protein